MNLIPATDPILHQATAPVDDIAIQVRPFIAEMSLLLKQARGVGLAAPQVGIGRSFFIFMNAPGTQLQVAINPAFTQVGTGRRSSPEGCLSYPGRSIHVDRWQVIQAHWTDLSGQVKHATLAGFPARVFQHEFDHLQGRTIFP